MKRAALYVRVSTDEQKKFGTSVDSQIDALRAYCADNGYLEAGLYNDAGFSARKSYKKRPELLRLLSDCEAGKIDVILFTKLDRWFRSIGDYYEIQRVLDQKKIKWRAIWEDNYNTDTSNGVFYVNVMLSIAQAEADRTSDRIKAVNSYRREVKHEYTSGKAATGYIVQNSKLLIDPEKHEAVKAFFDDYLSGFNLTHSVKLLHSLGVNIRRDTARRMLNNKVYYGDAYGYSCEPYITREQFDKIQSVLEGIKARPTLNPERVYLLTGLLCCEKCGSKMHASIRNMPSGGKIITYKYYRCPKNRNMACDNSRSKSELGLERDLISSIDAAMNSYNASIEILDAEVVDNTKKIAALNDRQERLIDLYELGDITRDEYLKRKKSIIKDIADLQAEPVIHEKKALPDGWQEIYKSLSDTSKRAFWVNTISKITMDQSGNIKIYF